MTGNYTWYRLSQYGGTPNTQGVELREYLVVFRGVSTNSNTPSFKLAISEGAFTPGFNTYTSLYNQMNATTSGKGLHVWNLGFANNAYIQIGTSMTFNPSNESFFFYIMGI
jgi:hypothetical protein